MSPREGQACLLIGMQVLRVGGSCFSALEGVSSPRPDALAISRWTRHGSRVSLLDNRYQPVCMYTGDDREQEAR